MGAEVLHGPWLWAAATLLLSAGPALSGCDVPTVTGSNVQGRVYDLLGGQAPPPAGDTVRLLTTRASWLR